jgi:hypothetical protein
MMKILNYPKTVEECKDLIDMLVARYNEKISIPSADDKKYQPPFAVPAGCNGGSESDSENIRGGGVGFMENMNHRPPSANESSIHGATHDYSIPV